MMRPEKERTISYRVTEEEWNEIEKELQRYEKVRTNGLALRCLKSSTAMMN